MRVSFYNTGILICLLLLFAKPVWAEKVKVTVTADEINYDYHSKQIEATGNVRISYKRTTVESDHAIIDHEQNILLATGKVKVVKDNDEFNGDRFLYYLETQQGWVYPVVSEITDAEIKGPMLFTAAEAFLKSEEILFKKTYVSGCELEHPHYHFTAKEIEYYPGDRIKMRHVWYWEHRIPLFYVPVLFISLAEDSNNFGIQVGWNNTDGWWVFTWYTYYFSDRNSLMVSNKTTERGVDYWGLQHINKLSSTRTLTESFEFADNDKIGNPYDDYKAGFKYEDKTYPKLNYETSLENWYRYTTTGEGYLENEFNYTLRGQSPYPFLALDYDTFGLKRKAQINLQESWRYNFDPTMGISLNGRWFYNELSVTPKTGKPVRNYTYDSSFDKRWDWSQLTVKAHESRTIGYSSENVIPDLTYTIPKWDWPLIGDVKVITQYTEKEKYNGFTDITTEGERSALDIQKVNKLWAKGSLSLDNKTYYRFRNYSVENVSTDLNALTEELDLTNRFTEELSTTVSLGFTRVTGENNTFFNDNIRPGAEIWNSWNWRSEHLSANLKTGYNFETVYAYPVNFDSSWNSKSAQLSFRTVYYWDNGPGYQLGLGETSLEVNSNPKQDWHIRLNMTYDFWSQAWWSKYMNIQLLQPVGENWKVGLDVTYDMFIDDFSNANATLIYDWHCRQLEMHYDWVEKEYWIQLVFKAFPQARFNTSDNPWEYLNYE